MSVREYAPRTSKYDTPAMPKGGKAVKIGMRIPGIVGSHLADITWLERELLAHRASIERWTRRPRVLDLDDAIWLLSPGDDFALEIAAHCDAIVVCNSYLARHFESLDLPTWVIPTAIDVGRWRPQERGKGGEFVVGWTGLASNLPNLYALEPALSAFFESAREAVLLIISETEPRFTQLDPRRVRWIPWSQESEARSVGEMDVGLMPLPETAWSCGKCAFKLIQYMAAGVPVVATPIGMNAQILDSAKVGFAAREPHEWTEALSELHADAALRRRLGTAGRQLAEEGYSRERIAASLARVFHELVGQ